MQRIAPYISHVFDIAEYAKKNNIYLSDFYFSRELKFKEEEFLSHLQNPKDEDLFILFSHMDVDPNIPYDKVRNAIINSSLENFYILNNMFIFAAKTPIDDLKELKIEKKDLLK